MRSFTSVRPGYFLLGWFLLNLLQAGLTPIDADEAYYWMYAQQLDWGYFDHPPLVALLVSLGKDWLPGSLGLRFGHVLLGTATVAGLWRLAGRPPAGPAALVLALLIFAQPMLQVYGFIATPDGPLLAGAVAFWLALRRFLRTPSPANALLWGAAMAFMIYAKYHGILVIAFTVIALPRLWRQPWFYLAGAFGAALYLPHLYWQYLHDFPSFRYHLSGRNDAYQLKYTTGYLLNQLLIFCPLFLYHYAKILFPPRPLPQHHAEERAMYWNIFAFLAFFLYGSTNGHTEAQWTAVLCIPLTVLLYRRALARPAWLRQLRTLGLIAAGLFLLARLLLIAPREWLPFNKPFDNQPWVTALAEVAGDRPVIFENSYRTPSLYRFYTGRPAYTFTNVYYRPSQYDLWDTDTAYHDRPVLLAGNQSWNCYGCDTFQSGKVQLKIRSVQRFPVIKSLRFRFSESPDRLPSFLQDSTATWRLEYQNPYPYALPTHAEMPLRLYAMIEQADSWDYRPLPLNLPPTLPPTGPDNWAALPPFQSALYHDSIPPGHTFFLGLAYRGFSPLRSQSQGIKMTD